MAKLTAKKRGRLKKNQFALPASRKFPLDTRNRAINAKARATQAVKTGRMSPSTAALIKARANKVLRRKGRKKR